MAESKYWNKGYPVTYSTCNLCGKWSKINKFSIETESGEEKIKFCYRCRGNIKENKVNRIRKFKIEWYYEHCGSMKETVVYLMLKNGEDEYDAANRWANWQEPGEELGKVEVNLVKEVKGVKN